MIDEGPGAPAEIAEHLFDPFVTSKRSGGGLGLALVDKLVADHGGIVEYAREGKPPRTVFRLLLPRANPPSRVSGARILVVDDDAAIRTVVREALRRAGYQVEVAALARRAARGDGALRRRRCWSPTSCCPTATGSTWCPSCCAANPGMPIIVLSAQNTLATAVRATEQGAFEYLPKPFDLGELTRAVADALAACSVRGATPRRTGRRPTDCR